MKGIVRKISKVTRNKKDGKTFNQIVITVDVIVDEEKKTLKTRSAYLGEQYAKEYAEYCKLSSNDMIGKEVFVVLEKKIYEKDGVEKIIKLDITAEEETRFHEGAAKQRNTNKILHELGLI